MCERSESQLPTELDFAAIVPFGQAFGVIAENVFSPCDVQGLFDIRQEDVLMVLGHIFNAGDPYDQIFFIHPLQ
jgi:hypothetical protein